MEGRVFLLIFSSSFPLCSSKFCERFPPSSLWVPKGGSVMGYFAGVRDVFFGSMFHGGQGGFVLILFYVFFFSLFSPKACEGLPPFRWWVPRRICFGGLVEIIGLVFLLGMWCMEVR